MRITWQIDPLEMSIIPHLAPPQGKIQVNIINCLAFAHIMKKRFNILYSSWYHNRPIAI